MGDSGRRGSLMAVVVWATGTTAPVLVRCAIGAVTYGVAVTAFVGPRRLVSLIRIELPDVPVNAPDDSPRAGRGSLGILAQRLHGRITGVGRYIECLLDVWIGQLRAAEFPFARIVLLSRERLDSGAFGQLAAVENRYRPSALPVAVWEQVHAPGLARDLDVLFCPGYTAPLRSPCPTVVATLDMLQVTRARDYPLNARLFRGPLYRLSARRADQVITLAEATVPSIVAHYGVDPSRIHAMPLAADPRFTHVADPADAARLDRHRLSSRPFVLFVGKLVRRRHVPELIAGFLQATAQQRLPHHLVFVGPDPNGLFPRAASDRVRYLGHVPDADLPAIYRRADLLAYLSEDEGFGLPIIEAMRSGTPVLTLDRPVLREVAGDATHYMDRATPERIQSALGTLLGDDERLRALSAAGIERARRFNWRVTADRTLEVLAGVAMRRLRNP